MKIRYNIFLINIVTVFIRYNGYFTVITDKNRIYNGKKKLDWMYQIELVILFSVIPSLTKTSENSLQGSFRRVQSRFCPLSFDGTLTYITPPG